MLKDRLKYLRNEIELKQEDIADKLNVARSTYGNWELGRTEPDIKALIKLARFYKVSLDYLCGNTDVKEMYVRDKRKSMYISKCLKVYDEFLK
ncbi:helix-turn-helix transcriptional regulator [Clostridium butyricum]|uniref:Transcriptional regulator, XRE family n=1 Tax=Clostridium butyricum E4 str. BoNT E BL5262 TaxID=632245 RepID=C4IJJ2_CLOBU|nr:helix-turn-helix transcriptional regulator [Clostridium butyricum]EDT74793.1 transcriptional regulator, XRE family [Clostridium butyricum 5521]EEP53480.1 transcriptional regulator, XRE family [Clostridium butyricum E4 str. BoNT E BL5262]NFL30975.1 helix-turn-helix transcriptional regulator [Clostridium butyricum]NFS16958.1 helix-turn-helix transcriptional regulator [Clostridium butyricum]